MGSDVVEHASHQAIGIASAPHLGISLHIWDDDDLAVEVVIGDRHDAVVDKQLVAFAFGVVAHQVLHEESLAETSALPWRRGRNLVA